MHKRALLQYTPRGNCLFCVPPPIAENSNLLDNSRVENVRGSTQHSQLGLVAVSRPRLGSLCPSRFAARDSLLSAICAIDGGVASARFGNRHSLGSVARGEAVRGVYPHLLALSCRGILSLDPGASHGHFLRRDPAETTRSAVAERLALLPVDHAYFPGVIP